MSCRVVYLVGQLSLGGLERQLCYLLKAMDRDRYKPAVVVWNYNETEPYVPQIRELAVPLYPLPGTLSSLQKLRKFHCLLEDLKPEVIHSYTFFTNFAAWSAAWGSRALPI